MRWWAPSIEHVASTRLAAKRTAEPMAGSEDSESMLWDRLCRASDALARQVLIERYIPYARIVAASYYARRIDDDIDFADYFQMASMAVVESIDRFDPSRGVQFKTFAARRMHGAILSGIERFTEKQQQVAVRRRLAAQRVQAAKSDASARMANGSPEGADVFTFLAEVGIGLALGVLLEGTGMVDRDALGQSSEPDGLYQQVELAQLRQRVAKLVDKLPEQQRTVLHSHYVLDTTFEQIAGDMRLSKGRVSQIHKQALETLRRRISDRPSLSLSL